MSVDSVGSAATSLEVRLHVQEGPDDDQWSPDTWEEDFFSHPVKAESDSCLHTYQLLWDFGTQHTSSPAISQSEQLCGCAVFNCLLVCGGQKRDGEVSWVHLV